MVEPLISDHPKCQVKVVAYRGWSLVGGVRLSEVRPQWVHILSNLHMVTGPFGQLLSKHIVITFSGLKS